MQSIEDNITKITELIPEPALYEQLAEECTELGKAALKMARILRNENKTPVTKEEALANLKEEYTDVVLSAATVNLNVDTVVAISKMERWVQRNS